MTVRIAVALRDLASGRHDAAGQLKQLRQLCGDVMALRKGDHNAQRLRIEREKLDLELKEFEEQKAARKTHFKQPSKAPKDWVMSEETRDCIRAELKRLRSSDDHGMVG